MKVYSHDLLTCLQTEGRTYEGSLFYVHLFCAHIKGGRKLIQTVIVSVEVNHCLLAKASVLRQVLSYNEIYRII
jgi:hypothetical protein